MSTKYTLSHGDNFHLYKECFDDSNVHLQLDGVQFEASQNSVCVTIPVVIWEVIRKQAGIDLFWPTQSDDAIRQFVEIEVDKRICEFTKSDKSINIISGIMLFGPVTDDRETQIQRAIEYYQSQREEQLKIHAQIIELSSK